MRGRRRRRNPAPAGGPWLISWTGRVSRRQRPENRDGDYPVKGIADKFTVDLMVGLTKYQGTITCLPHVFSKHLGRVLQEGSCAYDMNLVVANLTQSIDRITTLAVDSGGYVLAVEGGIPTAFDGNACWAWRENGHDVTFADAKQLPLRFKLAGVKSGEGVQVVCELRKGGTAVARTAVEAVRGPQRVTVDLSRVQPEAGEYEVVARATGGAEAAARLRLVESPWK